MPEAERRQQALGASGAAVETTPKRTRRSFSAAEKLRIVKKADACLASGERGALEAMLREEGLYSSALSSWRGQLSTQGTAGLAPRKVGRKPKLDAKDRLNAQLLKRTAVLERKLHIAEAVIALQKNYRARRSVHLLDQKLPTWVAWRAGESGRQLFGDLRTRKKTWSGGGLRT